MPYRQHCRPVQWSGIPPSHTFAAALSCPCRYGDAIALSGRDCSVQRRHQKIVEEGPVLAATPEAWDAMERAAVNLAKEVCMPACFSAPSLYPDRHSAAGFDVGFAATGD